MRGESLVRVDEMGTAETTGISSWGGAVGAQSSIIVIVRGGLRCACFGKCGFKGRL